MDKHYNNIREPIENHQVEVKKNEIKSNYHTVKTYYEIGKELIEAQGGENKAKYGNEIIKKYSIKFIKEYGKGYDESNLKRMRKFYVVFQKGGPVGHQLLNWSHYRTLLPIKENQKGIII